MAVLCVPLAVLCVPITAYTDDCLISANYCLIYTDDCRIHANDCLICADDCLVCANQAWDNYVVAERLIDESGRIPLEGFRRVLLAALARSALLSLLYYSRT